MSKSPVMERVSVSPLTGQNKPREGLYTQNWAAQGGGRLFLNAKCAACVNNY